MNYIITGGTGFIGTHLTNLIKECYPNANIYNLDIVKPGTPNPVVKDYKPAVLSGKDMIYFTLYECKFPGSRPAAVIQKVEVTICQKLR